MPLSQAMSFGLLRFNDRISAVASFSYNTNRAILID
jgi:hypothetical protein